MAQSQQEQFLLLCLPREVLCALQCHSCSLEGIGTAELTQALRVGSGGSPQLSAVFSSPRSTVAQPGAVVGVQGSLCLRGPGRVPWGNHFLQKLFHRLKRATLHPVIRLSGLTLLKPPKQLCLCFSELLLLIQWSWSLTLCKVPVQGLWSHWKLMVRQGVSDNGLAFSAGLFPLSPDCLGLLLGLTQCLGALG